MNTQSALINPHKLPENLNEAERQFVACMEAGTSCVFGTGRPKPNDENAHIIRADVVRFFVYGGNSYAPIIGNEIFLSGARIVGALHLMPVSIPYAITFYRCHFDKIIYMPHLECPSLGFFGSFLAEGLQGQGMKITNDMNMGAGFSAEGQINLLNAKIGGSLIFSQGNFKKKNNKTGGRDMEGATINANQIEVGKNVSMSDGFWTDGEVSLIGADIKGELSCSNGKFLHKDGYSLVAESLILGRHLYLRRGFLAEGEVSLFGAHIDGDVYCLDGTFKKGIFAQNAKIKNGFIWGRVRGSGTVNLSFASAAVLNDDAQSHEGFKFNLREFSYSNFYKNIDIKSRIAWLKGRPENEPFSQQPFEHAADVLFSTGDNSDAREILQEKEKLQTRHGKMPGVVRVARWLWGILAGYGYLPQRMMWWSLGIIFAGAVFFGIADYNCHIVPSQPTVVVDAEYRAAETHRCTIPGEPTKGTVRLFPEYSEFHPVVYSMDVFFPFFAMHQEPYWEPKSKKEFPEVPGISGAMSITDIAIKILRFVRDILLYFLRVWFWLEIAAGWTLTSLFVFSITNLLRPRQSSGKE